MEKMKVAGVVWTDRRPGIEAVCAEVRRRNPKLTDHEVVVQAKLLYTSRYVMQETASGRVVVENPRARRPRTTLGRVAGAQHPTPPMGPPAGSSRRGNSTPTRAPVAGVRKSERFGEPGAAK